MRQRARAVFHQQQEEKQMELQKIAENKARENLRFAIQQGMEDKAKLEQIINAGMPISVLM